MRKGFSFLVAAALSSRLVLGQEPPAFPSRVDAVTLDVVVTDRQGHPVTGLTIADFQVTDEGRAQAIIAFKAVGRGPKEHSREGPPSDRTSIGPARTTFLIVFDDVHIEPAKTRLATGAIKAFIDNATIDSDTLVLVTATDGVRTISRDGSNRQELVDALSRLEGRKIVDPCQSMTEFEAMRTVVQGEPLARSVNRPSQFHEKSACQGGSSMEADAIHRETLRRDAQTLETLSRVFPMFDQPESRLTVMLLSGGFIDDPTLRGEVTTLLRATSRLRAVVHFVDVSGLRGFFDVEKAGGAIAAAEETSGAVKLADDTGGLHVHDTNDLASMLYRIAEEGRTYYLIGYAPSEVGNGGKEFRRLRVRVAKPGLKVRSRPGYFR
jgi:VWFA-related protein